MALVPLFFGVLELKGPRDVSQISRPPHSVSKKKTPRMSGVGPLPPDQKKRAGRKVDSERVANSARGAGHMGRFSTFTRPVKADRHVGYRARIPNYRIHGATGVNEAYGKFGNFGNFGNSRKFGKFGK